MVGNHEGMGVSIQIFLFSYVESIQAVSASHITKPCPVSPASRVVVTYYLLVQARWRLPRHSCVSDRLKKEAQADC